MKRNITHMDKLLLYLEESPAAWVKFESDNQKEETIVALYLLADRGYVALKESVGSAIARITWDGYHYLGNLHEDIRRTKIVEESRAKNGAT